MHIAATVAALALVAGPAASDPVLPNLEGIALEDGSGLTLLAAGELIDVDTAGRRPIDGLPADPPNWWAFQQGRHVVVQVDCLDCAVRPEAYVFELGGDAPARRIATERFVTPAADDTLLARVYDSPTSCRLERIDLDGNVIDPAQPIDCQLQPVGETDAWIIARDYVNAVADDTVVLDPATLYELLRWRAPLQFHAIVGNQALLSDHDEFRIVDLATNEEVRLDAPDAVGHPGEGLVSPDGRFVAIEYRSPEQIMDLWLLDLDQLAWLHAPSMPVRAMIKRPLPVWTPDGRLAVVGTFGRGDYRHLLAVWRPGDADLAIREVDTDAYFVLIDS